MSDLRLNRFEPVLTGYLRSGPVIWGLAIIGNRLRLRSVEIWPKNRTGPDFQTLSASLFFNLHFVEFELGRWWSHRGNNLNIY